MVGHMISCKEILSLILRKPVSTKWIVYVRVHAGDGGLSQVHRVGSVIADDALQALEMGRVLTDGRRTVKTRAGIEVRRSGIKPLEKILAEAETKYANNKRRCHTSGRPSAKAKAARERYRADLADAESDIE